MGFGLALQDFGTLPSISARYHFSRHVTGSFYVGFNTQSLVDAFILGGKLYRNIHLEDNINFYLGAGLGLLSQKTASISHSGFELSALIGAEFFFSELRNLGIQFETGIAVRSLDTVSFKTLGSSFAGAGIHYYF